jgi:CHAT domain-containing protein
VKQILDELQRMDIFKSSELPRVCWIGSGIATNFPFHAASGNFNNANEDTLNRIVSSYSSTIKTLSYSQSRAIETAHTGGDQHSSIAVVSMPTTPGYRPLEGAEKESGIIKEICSIKYSFRSLDSPTANLVLQAIPESDVLHFACHGVSDPINPLQSHLLLQKQDGDKQVEGNLGISQLSEIAATGRARMVFLSACSTAEVKHRKLGDEGLHMASMFQIVGFAHVIWSMWTADDSVCVEVASAFYNLLTHNGTTATFSNDCVARALQGAMIKIHKKYPDDPAIWAPFVHFGA